MNAQEKWMTDVMERLRPYIAECGYTFPDNVIVRSCQLPADHAGEFWQGEPPEIRILSRLVSWQMVSGVLVHEIGHACLPEDVCHGTAFQKFCIAVGIGFPYASPPGAALRMVLAGIISKIGPYPVPDPAMFDIYVQEPSNWRKNEYYKLMELLRILGMSEVEDVYTHWLHGFDCGGAWPQAVLSEAKRVALDAKFHVVYSALNAEPHGLKDLAAAA